MQILNKIIFCLTIIFLGSFLSACLLPLQVKKSAEKIKTSSTTPSQNQNRPVTNYLNTSTERGKFESAVYYLLNNKDFERLENLANQVRREKLRLTGGYWQIDVLYFAASTIYREDGGYETDEIWNKRIELINLWKEKYPNSISARVALARAYMGYGWFARGSGYANTVSDENWKLLKERLELAENELIESRQLNEKCPGWYREMLFLGMANSWSAKDFEALFEEAVRFEPNYLQFYLVKSENLTPKWGGSQQEWDDYVNSISEKVQSLNSDEGNIIYFIVLAGKMNEKSLNINYFTQPKDRIRDGFLSLEKKYGVDNLRLNQYAYLSTLISDYPAAKDAFDRIGDDVDEDVWQGQNFFAVKEIAERYGSTKNVNSKDKGNN